MKIAVFFNQNYLPINRQFVKNVTFKRFLMQYHYELYIAEQVEQNDKLSMEILTAVNSQLVTLDQSAAAAERDRMKAVVSQLAQRVFLA